jgi:chromosome segregation ATPase
MERQRGACGVAVCCVHVVPSPPPRPPPPPPPSLSPPGGKYRLSRDCIKFDRAIAKAVDYAVGTSVICDTLADARVLRFEREVVVKCIALDGGVIAKSGNMTGGSPDEVEKHSSRYAEACGPVVGSRVFLLQGSV